MNNRTANYQPYRWLIGISTTFIITSTIAHYSLGQSLRELDAKSAGGMFARMWRTAAAQKTVQPSNPSIARNGKGELLLLLTHLPDGSSPGVIAIAKATDSGRTWSQPQTIHRSAKEIPKASGTLTRLHSGKLVAPFTEGDQVRILSSDDDGTHWSVTAPIDCGPLKHAVPYSRLVEHRGGLLMSLYGYRSHNGKNIPCSGLLRSQDGGVNWSWFAEIAGDHDAGKIEYGPTAVHPLPNNRLLALISVGDRSIYRSLSDDGGQTWSIPQQKLLACHPTLAQIGTILACAAQDTQARGVVRVMFSENQFDSWRCDRMPDQDIQGENFSMVTLDSDRLLVAHDRSDFKPLGRGTPITEGIEILMFQRNPAAPATRPTIVPPKNRDRWELAYLLPEFPIETGYGLTCVTPNGKLLAWSGNKIYEISDRGRKVTVAAQAPTGKELNSFDPGVFTVLSSGRWIVAAREQELTDWDGLSKHVGRGDDGYDYYQYSGVKGLITFRPYYSDDQGKTWQEGESRANIEPLAWAHASGRFIETDDGTLILPVLGGLSAKDTSGRLDCAGIFRSTDGGLTWGDFTLVAHDAEHRQIAYNEIDIEPMPDGTWMAILRTEWRNHHGGEAASASVCYSQDQGRNWTKPEFVFIGAVPDLALLPDGGLVCSTSFSKLRFSYDGGQSWSRELNAHSASHSHSYPGVERLDDDHLFVFGRWKGRGGCVYRRVMTRK